ncbi:hypothetical protein SAMN03159341_103267 [Paenibacillus sp. 1_12]|uniref:glucosamine inositolphosphorylceramide transferase family protein n=1 Tax=Paenibacillus sp. 1_12 TaxID=1566278 RepID=UPI0008E575FA|nr:hypothetical protein [Paenibacillus sp. 1_12]SFL11043.1 hypothetical protein SAMN03159341_103267 [Paenibacillus sp. 1_12]
MAKKHIQKLVNWLYLIRNGMNIPIWSIAVFMTNDVVSAKSLQEMNLDIPTLQASDVNDVQAEFVADPFIIRHDSQFYMFFEVMNKVSGRGEIAAAVSLDGVKWDYQQIVIREPFHISYPQVFKVKDDIYMIPETIEANRVLLYKAKQFPILWEKTSELLDGHYLDPSVIEYAGKWWMFAGTEERNLHLFAADTLEGPWSEHPSSPIITNDISITRPGGRLIVSGDHLYRYTQNCYPYYGISVKEFKVKALSETEYEEEEISQIMSGTQKDSDWRRDGMHHIDQLRIDDNQWLVAVDGHTFKKSNYFVWKFNRIFEKVFS